MSCSSTPVHIQPSTIPPHVPDGVADAPAAGDRDIEVKLDGIITGKKDAKMSWSNYEIDVCEAHKVKLVGWLVTQTDADGNVAVKMSPLNLLPAETARLTLKGLKNGTIFFVAMSKAEHDALVAKHDALRAANGPLKKRAQRSDFGKKHASRKRKADGNEDEDEDEEDEEDSSDEGGAEPRTQKKRRTSQDANSPTSNAPAVPNAPTTTSSAPIASNLPNAPATSNAPTTPNAPTTSNTPTAPTVPTSTASNAPSAPKKGRKGKKKAKDAPASARPVPRPRRRPAPPTASAPATDAPAAENTTPSLRLPSPEPSHAMYASTATPHAPAFDFGLCSEAHDFGALGPDSWGLPHGGQMPGVDFGPELMSLLQDAVNGAPLWDNGAIGSTQAASGPIPQPMVPPSSVRGSPLLPLNGSTPLTRLTPTDPDGLGAKQTYGNITGTWGENAPPSAAGTVSTSFTSNPSPPPYLITRFRL
ncbi:hypothetical protein MSAN_01914400 [Mycena sanguinolenta]|uniref:Uncharacterized protein n=1 Tax=Mycena sanguinolenta TaxID=230812 RepID=A0A8H7CNJ2_9AGAR|nr:hypothetical protein MSAN_01914400 [Mycena sanguinolenta]